MLRRTYDWTLSLSAHPNAVWALAAVAFIESSIFPIPPDVLLIPMVLAARDRAWTYAGICTIASVLGGLAGYAIGYWFYDAVGQPLLAFYGYQDEFQSFRSLYNEQGFWFVAMAGFTPFPYKVITIASGVFSLDLDTFLVASALSRGGRFILVAGLLWRFGTPIRAFIEKNLGLLTVAFFALLFGGFVVVRYLF